MIKEKHKDFHRKNLAEEIHFVLITKEHFSQTKSEKLTN